MATLKNKLNTYIYPIILSYEEDSSGLNYLVSIPDFDGFTQASTIEEAVVMGRDYIGNAMVELEHEGKEFPEFNMKEIGKLEKNKNDLIMPVDIDFKKFKASTDNRTVKKTLTIPNYLNVLAIDQHINFSEVLTQALKKELHIS